MNISKSAVIAEDATIYDNVEIGEHVSIGKGTILYPGVTIGCNTNIGPYCIIGEPEQSFYTSRNDHVFKSTVIGAGSIIRSHAVIYENVRIGKKFQTGHHVTIREETIIGCGCSLGTLGDIQDGVFIGDYVRIHSNVFIPKLTEIQDYVWIYPHAVITNDVSPPLGDLRGCKIGRYAQLAAASRLMPGVEIGENAFVGAGSLVTKNVEPMTVVFGTPATNRGLVSNRKNDRGEDLYPWREHLRQERGYPWQGEQEDE